MPQMLLVTFACLFIAALLGALVERQALRSIREEDSLPPQAY